MQPESKEQIGAAVFRSYVSAVRDAPDAARIRERLPADTRELWDDTPRFGWLPLRHLTELLRGVDALRGRERVRALVLEVCRNSVGNLLIPVVRTAFSLMGMSPATVLGRIDTIMGSQFRGASFAYQPASEKDGVLTITHAENADGLSWSLWQWSLEFIFDLCKVRGEISATPQDARTCRYQLRWS